MRPNADSRLRHKRRMLLLIFVPAELMERCRTDDLTHCSERNSDVNPSPRAEPGSLALPR